jgi:hypothetical protein
MSSFYTTHNSSVSTGFTEKIMSILRILCYNKSLATWTVVSLTTNTLQLHRCGTDHAENTPLILLRGADHIENIFTVLLRGACVGTCLRSRCLAILWSNPLQYFWKTYYQANDVAYDVASNQTTEYYTQWYQHTSNLTNSHGCHVCGTDGESKKVKARWPLVSWCLYEVSWKSLDWLKLY